MGSPAESASGPHCGCPGCVSWDTRARQLLDLIDQEGYLRWPKLREEGERRVGAILRDWNHPVPTPRPVVLR